MILPPTDRALAHGVWGVVAQPNHPPLRLLIHLPAPEFFSKKEDKKIGDVTAIVWGIYGGSVMP
jgi:hypothetical protein